MKKMRGNFYYLYLGINFCLFCGIVTSSVLYAQTEREIQLSGKYYWGTAKGEDEKSTKEAGLKDLIFNIQVNISLSQLDIEEEKDGRVSSYFSSIIKSSSRLSLRGVQYLVSRSKDKYKVIVYISKDDFQKALENISANIGDMVKLTEQNEIKNGIVKTFHNYYIAYLKTFYHPDPIFYKSITMGKEFQSIRPFLEEKVTSFLNGITVVPKSATYDPSIEMITIPFLVCYEDQSVDGIALQLDLPDQSERRVNNGSTELFLYFQPSDMQKKIPVLLGVDIDEKKDFQDLLDMHRTSKIICRKEVCIDFSNIIKLSFKIEKKESAALSFQPVIENLSISSIDWDFGDGSTSTEYNPLHKYKDSRRHKVTLTLNHSDSLKITRDILPDGTVFIETPQLTFVQELFQVKDFKELNKLLKYYKSKGKLMYGKKEAFLYPEKCLIFIVDPNTENIVAVLGHGKEERVNLLSDEIVYNLRDNYQGQVPIYVEVYR